jgi:hypothetical protein
LSLRPRSFCKGPRVSKGDSSKMRVWKNILCVLLQGFFNPNVRESPLLTRGLLQMGASQDLPNAVEPRAVRVASQESATGGHGVRPVTSFPVLTFFVRIAFAPIGAACL